MDPKTLKDLRWPVDRDRIREIQEELRGKLRIEPLVSEPSLIAGIDAAFFGDRIISAACLFTFPGLESLQDSYTVREASFPYITGLLSFREGPAVAEALEGLTKKPGLLIFDGQGIAHPRGMGLAAFMGALLDMPTIGCAKTRLVGEYTEPGIERGSHTPLLYKGNIVGAVLRTQYGVRPLFVSPGHRIDIKGSIDFVLRCAVKYRLTEPVRRAHMLSNKIRGDLQNLTRP